MSEGATAERRWLRPLGLLGLTLALSVGHPFVLIAVPFALLTFLTASGRLGALFLGAAAFALVFAGEAGGGLWYLERGWAVLIGGGFAAITLAWPHQSFFSRALAAVSGGMAWAALVLLALGGWASVEWMIGERVEAGAAATLQMMGALFSGSGEVELADTVRRTAELQHMLFPALMGLSSLAALGVAWWLHLRMTMGADTGLGPLRNFRFPDPLIWLFITGLLLVVVGGVSGVVGRVGVNLVVFMGALFALRGAAVLLFLAGGVSLVGGLAVVVGMLLAAPVLLAAAFVVGVGDSWFDLRTRAMEGKGAGPDST